jgi:GR25 family glycosyltransferase involved in LPS biosynthesis|tara:strand:+ start:280 stop:1623 length:1344 start_codon:yes stop_codon:yes gene_type:complete
MNTKYRTLGFDKIYVINLKRRNDRREKLTKSNPNIDFTFIEAVDGQDLTTEQLIEEGKLHTSFYDPSGMCTINIFACALSHKKAWDQALTDGVENALILEDDIYFTTPFIDDNLKDLTPLYKDILNDINQYDWDIIQLGKKRSFTVGLPIGKYFVSPRYKSNFDGAHAYAVTKQTLQDLSDKCLPVKYAADVYVEEFYNTHNLFTLKESLIRQISDTSDPQNGDSDTYYNDYRIGGGKVGISFDEKGNVINKQIAKYIKHPKDILQQHTEIVLERPKFGIQTIIPQSGPNDKFFGICDMLSFLSEKLGASSKMVEINSHFGENTFFFGSSGLFSNIYAIDALTGEDKFNIDNNITWEDVEIGFHSNTYFFNNINHIKNTPEDIVDSFDNISFLYINNRNRESIKSITSLYLSKMNQNGFIGGNNISDAPKNHTKFKDGSWVSLIKYF